MTSNSHQHGINLPLSALRSKNSCGIGDFYDLIPIIDWCAEIGLNVIQLLPLNDTGYDPSPYNALSSLALHPIYLSLRKLKYFKARKDFEKKLDIFKSYNRTRRVKYDDVLRIKMDFLHFYFHHNRKHYLKDESFQTFRAEFPWIIEYALFKILKEKQNLAFWEKWPDEIKTPSSETMQQLTQEYADEIDFFFFLQYSCFNQLIAVKRHAHERNIQLMGDIPILISPQSADVWTHHSHFNLNLAAGAPPDTFNKEGQYWGFPLFNWEAMEQDHFRWWQRRLQFAEHFYDIFRIDHVIGFYRIWAIPLGELASKGQYIPAKERDFLKQGEKILKKLLSFTHMIPIGEDLGIYPASMGRSLKSLNINRTIVMRWEKYRTTKKFIPFEKYTKHSLCTISTHDSETFTQWYLAGGKEVSAFLKVCQLPCRQHLTQKQRLELLKIAHHTNSHYHVNLLQEYLALYPDLVWECPDDARINRPGFILPTNWTFRFRASVEKITTHALLKASMKKIIS
ncbi:MAG: 4-alpha-glucanotransferase [Simkaniaceae bacterium]|nr:4-alpha-glucanotransferase [Simkaniaceae bacterium]